VNPDPVNPDPVNADPVNPRGALAAAVLTIALLTGCAASPVTDQVAPTRASGSPVATSSADPAPARLAKPARSQRVTFVPERVVLPGGASAVVVPAEVVDGVLQVPRDVRQVGWWTGSAYVGDPFGATVIAGHVDSAEQGIGFFARLLRIEKGDRLTVTATGHRATYTVSSAQLVAKQALTDDGAALDQTGDHRLVLITCAGRFRPEKGGYESNLVIVARPVGPAR
jgi:LPXTG-site transpeptidase (sortase) family protein